MLVSFSIISHHILAQCFLNQIQSLQVIYQYISKILNYLENVQLIYYYSKIIYNPIDEFEQN